MNTDKKKIKRKGALYDMKCHHWSSTMSLGIPLLIQKKGCRHKLRKGVLACVYPEGWFTSKISDEKSIKSTPSKRKVKF